MGVEEDRIVGLKGINLGLPETKDVEAPRSLIADRYPSIEARMRETPFKNGVALAILEQTEIEGVVVDLVIVRIAPGAKVSAHLHERNGEIEFPLTPVLSVIGDVLRTEDGEYELDPQGVIKGTIESQAICMPGLPRKIPEGKVHEYRNPMSDAYADVMFFLPHSHATAEDKKLAASPEIDAPTMSAIVQKFLREQAAE